MEKELLQGTPIEEYTPEQLKAEKQRIATEKLQIIADLNKIKTPLSVTVFGQTQTWSIRNVAFWRAMAAKDTEVTKFMEQYLLENK